MNWNQAHIDAFEWYGGLPRILVPDNCKTSVIHSNLYDPQINHAYRDLAHHYHQAFMPCRVKKPKDKPTVESGVGWLETWLLEWLKRKIYYSFAALNHDIRERVSELAEEDFKHRPGSRLSNFTALDQPALRPLPKDPFDCYETISFKRVPNNYHLKYREFYYSVPYMFYGRPVVMHAYARKIEIFDDMGNRIAIHVRRFSGRRYVTNEEHMPENHRAVADFNRYDGAYYRHQASRIGSSACRFICALLDEAEFEEQVYKSCMGIISFSKKYGDERVDRACEKALELRSVCYTTVKNILKNVQNKQPADQSTSDADIPTPNHENLRVGEWN